LLIALGGFKFDMVRGEISFQPVVNRDEFSTFWSTGKAWGTYSQTKTADGDYEIGVKVLYGDAKGIKVRGCGKVVEL
jgi:hypothetical protein